MNFLRRLLKQKTQDKKEDCFSIACKDCHLETIRILNKLLEKVEFLARSYDRLNDTIHDDLLGERVDITIDK